MDKAVAISSAANAWKSIAAKPDREHHHHHTRLELWRKPVRKEDVLEMQEELCKLPVFAQCIHSMEFLKSLARRVRIKTFSEGQLILGQGMPGKELILIRRGVALMYLADVQIDRVNAGHYIGETNFLGLEDTWKVDLRAERLCVVAALDRDDFFEVLEVFPHLEAYYSGITANHVSCRQDGTLCELCEIFRDLSESSLVSLDSRVLNRLYFDNEKMMEQGVHGNALYILVRGQVNIEIAGRAVRSDARNADMKYTSETISTGTFKVSNRTEPACFGLFSRRHWRSMQRVCTLTRWQSFLVTAGAVM
jgi:CRP-like cAMP-binding protein